MAQAIPSFSAGDKVWVPHEKDAFQVARVKEKLAAEKSYVVFNEDYKSWKVKDTEIAPVNPPNMDGVPDNTQMMYLHDPSLLYNLKIRYQKDEIYTFTAYILIAINPYKRLPIYEDKYIWQYSGKSIGQEPPHVYAIADRAYRSMKANWKSQSVVVSGESGAGKTETCKFLMRFLAVVSGSHGNENTNAGVVLDEIENKILQSNPILEAFGNAKTLRNNNSSRFGKYTQLHFNKQSKLVGASIVTYLLEKSRAVFQAKMERNFHIFYQLLAGASAEEKNKWKLLPLDKYIYLNKSGCTTVDGVNDSAEYAKLKECMTAVGISAESQDAIFATISGLLSLGSVEFATANTQTEEKTIVALTAQDALAAAAALLGLSKEELADKLVVRSITVGKSRTAAENKYKIPLTVQEAVYSRDALAKQVYGTVFEWLVNAINKSLPSKDSAASIGILDISGFEIFENNTFEQLCINFANEKIQQYFNQQILKQEQEIYLLEGLKWRQVEYKDNQGVINLVEQKRTGIFALLDEECIVPKGSDRTFCGKIHATHSSNPNLDIPKYGAKVTGKKLTKDEGFVVKHFAGDVIYNVSMFLDKNNDSLHDDLANLLTQSTKNFIKEMFPATILDEDTPIVGNKRFKSVNTKFQTQLNHLMDQLNSTVSHFIRCIKPNQLQKPEIFENENVMQQLRYNGMCTALTLMQAGFPTRCNFEDLYERYVKFMPPALTKLKPITFCEALLVALDLNGGKDFQMGLTKVFFKAGKLKFLDELTSNSQQYIGGVVSKVKKWLARKRWKGAIFGVIALRRLYKRCLKIRAVHRFRKAGRFMLRMVRIWIPLVTTARKNLLTSEEYKKRMEEEQRRKEEERMAEQRRIEEEERRRKEKEEEQRRAVEEAKRALEEQKRMEEEARKAMEEQLKSNKQKITEIETTLVEEQNKAQHLQLQNEQLSSKIKVLNDEIVKSQATYTTMEAQLKTEAESRKTVEKSLTEVQTQLQQANREKKELSIQLTIEKETLESVRQTLNTERDAHKTDLMNYLNTSQSEKSQLEEQISKLRKEKIDIETLLQNEVDGRKLEVDQLKKQIEKEHSNQKKLIEEHNKEKQQFENQLHSEKENNDALQRQLASERESHKTQIDSIMTAQQTDKSTIEERMSALLAEKMDIENKLRQEKELNRTLTREKEQVEKRLAQEQTALKNHQEESKKTLEEESTKYQQLQNELNELNKTLTAEKEANKNNMQAQASKHQTEKNQLDEKLEKLTAEKNDLELKLKDEQSQVKQLQRDKALLESNLQQEQQSFKNLSEESQKKLEEQSEKYENLKKELEAKLADSQNTMKNEIQQRDNEKSQLQEQLLAEKNQVAQLSSQKSHLEKELSESNQSNTTLKQELRVQKDVTVSLETQVKSLESLRDQLKESLAREQDTVKSLKASLEKETTERREEAEQARQLLETTKKKAAADYHTLQTNMTNMEKDKNNQITKLQTDLQTANSNASWLKNQLLESQASEQQLNIEVNKMKKEIETLNQKVETLEKEKASLMNSLEIAQTAQSRLKSIFERYAKPDALVRLVFGDVHFNTIIRGATKCATLMKQGKSESKWQARHVILNDTWLFYFASPGDKEPKGMLRLDGGGTEVSRVDLSKAKKSNGFSIRAANIKKPNKKQSVIMSAPSEDECDEWIKVISAASVATHYL